MIEQRSFWFFTNESRRTKMPRPFVPHVPRCVVLQIFSLFLFFYCSFLFSFSPGHERWSSTGDFIRIPRTDDSFARIYSTGDEVINVMKCKFWEMERKYQATVISSASCRYSENHGRHKFPVFIVNIQSIIVTLLTFPIFSLFFFFFFCLVLIRKYT